MAVVLEAEAVARIRRTPVVAAAAAVAAVPVGCRT